MPVPRSSPDISALEYVSLSGILTVEEGTAKNKEQKSAFKEKSKSERQCPYCHCCPERAGLGLSGFEGSASHFHSELVPLTQGSHSALPKQSQFAAEMSPVLALPKLV